MYSVSCLPSRLAKGVIRKIVEEESIVIVPHAKARMVERDISHADVVFTLRSGVVEEAEFENGDWRYRVRSPKAQVVVVIEPEDLLIVVTVLEAP